MTDESFKLDPKLNEKMIEAAGDVARATVTSPMFMEALVSEMLTKVAKGPMSLLSRAPHSIHKSELLTPPATLEDGRILVLTKFPVDIPSSYTLMVLPAVSASDASDGPTPVGAVEEFKELTLIWKDHPGQIGHNHMVNLHPYEEKELIRQLQAAKIQGPAFLYLTSLELGHDHTHESHTH